MGPAHGTNVPGVQIARTLLDAPSLSLVGGASQLALLGHGPGRHDQLTCD